MWPICLEHHPIDQRLWVQFPVRAPTLCVWSLVGAQDRSIIIDTPLRTSQSCCLYNEWTERSSGVRAPANTCSHKCWTQSHHTASLFKGSRKPNLVNHKNTEDGIGFPHPRAVSPDTHTACARVTLSEMHTQSTKFWLDHYCGVWVAGC